MLLFLTKVVKIQGVKTGRERLSEALYDILCDTYGEGVQLIKPTISKNRTKRIINIFRGYIDDGSPEFADSVCRRLDETGAKVLFVDGSNYGQIIRDVKRRRPHIKIVTFFHNCEAIFFLGALKNKLHIKTLFVLLFNYIAERNASRLSNIRIVLSARDEAALNKLYGKSNSCILPMFISDNGTSCINSENSQNYVLFVGGAFYANVDGIKWFTKNVSPYLSLPTVIVGAGFEKYRTIFEKCTNVRVVGTVSDLKPWYGDAKVVIAPIFDGSGMKTKVAEALMYGRPVVGTHEALIGYEPTHDVACFTCATAGEFVKKINFIINSPDNYYYAARTLYEMHYSRSSACNQILNILQYQDTVGLKNNN